MSELPPDISAQIDGFLSVGYTSPEEVLREALVALGQRDADIAAIQQGIADETAGRVRPAAVAMSELRRKHDLPAS
ncbi:MAG: hypothetical protein AAF266_13280 [Planctomycetota bacterium]